MSTEAERIAVWAAVSTRPQAEKDSIPDQLAAGRAFVVRRGGLLVSELIVPGESRSYPTIAEAVQGMGDHCAYTDLLAMLNRRSIDLLWCRSLDRLGRTDPLIAEVQWRCQQAGAIVYSEQMPPTGQQAGDLYLSAIERAGAQRELIELRRRAHYGMNARARRGDLMALGRTPFGYDTAYEGRNRIAVVNPEQAKAVQWLFEAVLNRQMTDKEITNRLREAFPFLRWANGIVTYMLRNPFYAGRVVRSAFGVDGQPVRIETQGKHEAIIDEPTWQAAQRYLNIRAANRRPPGKSLWAGLLVCDHCNHRLHGRIVQLRSGTQQVYYSCYGNDKDTCTMPNNIDLATVTAGVVVYLRQLYESEAEELVAMTATSLPDPIPAFEHQRLALLQRRDRLTVLFSTNRISLDEFDAARAAIQREIDGVDAQLTVAHKQTAQAERQRDTLDMLRDVLPDMERRLLAIDPAEGNRWLRDIFTEIRVRDKRVVAVTVA